jgi:hypothetical protein
MAGEESSLRHFLQILFRIYIEETATSVGFGANSFINNGVPP